MHLKVLSTAVFSVFKCFLQKSRIYNETLLKLPNACKCLCIMLRNLESGDNDVLNVLSLQAMTRVASAESARRVAFL